jgi:hypothetical protein
MVLTTPDSRAAASRLSMKARTDGNPAKYALMNSCAASCDTPMSLASVNAVFPYKSA